MARQALVVIAAALLVIAIGWQATSALGSQRQGPAGNSAATEPGHSPSPVPQVDEHSFAFGSTGWKTDFSKRTVDLDEIRSGGVPRDGIPPIDRPQFQPAVEVDWLGDVEPVIAFEHQGESRAYPLQILIWHEIVNDVVGQTPVAVTFCPLCNTAIVFERRVEGTGTLRFGTSGNLRYSDLVMWDDRTESWWQQITGEAIVGTLAGTRLKTLPAQIVGFGEFKAAFPQGKVLTRDTGFARDYGRNPYVGYDDVTSSPFLYEGAQDGRLRPMERVVAVDLGGEDVAYSFSALADRRVIQDTVGGTPIVVLHQPGTTSALDGAQIASSRDVGATGVFVALLNGQMLTFTAAGDGFQDVETGSTWNVLGQAVAGPLAGSRLEPVEHGNHFWFAWAAFKPQTRVWQDGD